MVKRALLSSTRFRFRLAFFNLLVSSLRSFANCLRCDTQALWHTKVWDEVELVERAGEGFRPREIMVRREQHKGDGRTARLDFEELAGRLDRLALE